MLNTVSFAARAKKRARIWPPIDDDIIRGMLRGVTVQNLYVVWFCVCVCMCLLNCMITIGVGQLKT